jgi:hypothetical protein
MIASAVELYTVSLWLQNDLLGILNLPEGWTTCNYSQKELEPGENYFIDDPTTPEAAIKAKGWQRPDNCRVHRVSTPVDRLIANSKSAREFLIQLIEFSQSFADWAKCKDSEPLTVKQATDIAKVAFHRLSGVDLQTELATLRVRCNQTSYDWNKLMASLEEEFKKQLELRGISTGENQAERLKLEVKRYLAEKDESKKALIAKDLRKQGISNQEIKAIANQLDTKSSTPKAKCFTPQELLNYVPDGLQWLLPGLLPAAGVTFLGGSPGAGKSTLAYDCGASILSGESFLGEHPTKTGKILIVVSDESLAYIQDKLISRGFYAYMGGWELIYDWDITQWDVLEEKLEDFRPTLTIFDSFASIHRNQVLDENSSAAASTVFKLNSLLERYNSAGLMIHHANKNKEQKGVDKLRGSTAISAAASTIWLLSGEGSIKKFSTPKLRGAATPVNLDISLNLESGKFEVVAGDEELQQAKSVMQRVRELFESLGCDRRLELAEIQHEVGGSRDSLYQAISRLCNQGVIVKAPSKKDPRKKGYYLSPKYIHFTPSPSPDPFILSDIMPESYTPQGLDISDKIPDKISDISDNISDNIPDSVLCQTSQSFTGQGFSEKYLTEKTVPQGGGGNSKNTQFANVTEIETNTISEKEIAPTTSPTLQPHFEVGQRVEFQHENFDGWHKGQIVDAVYQDGYFIEVVVAWSRWNRKTKQVESMPNYRISNDSWVKLV